MTAGGGTIRGAAGRGFVMITMIVCLTIVVAFLGLAIDVGYEQYMKVRMQTAADAGALGGAREIRASGSSNVVSAAKGDAATNGFVDGQNHVTITVNNPPLTGYSMGDATAVEVLISQTVPTFFMRLLGFSSGTVKARAVARTGSSTNCFYALNPTMSGAFPVSNGVNVSSACGIMVNSNSTKALTATGGAVLTAPTISVVGKYTISNGATINPLPTQGVASPGNPLASLPAPTVPACTNYNFSVGGGINTTIQPGTYCGGITISNGATVKFSPGNYYLKGGGMAVSGAGVVTGTGVFLYNTYGTGYPYAPFNFSNGSNVTLAAQTAGTYAGILMFQDPTVVGGAATTFQGGTVVNLTGTLYFPTTQLAFNNGANAAYTILVADSFSFTGGITIHNDYSSLPGGSPIKGNTALSE